MELLREHLELLLPVAADVYQRAANVLQANPTLLSKLYGTSNLIFYLVYFYVNKISVTRYS
jgi:hypothetical protein